jgi:predicted transcriptional regulator
MTTVTLNLTDDLQQFVAREAQAASYSDPAAYIQALIERTKKGKERLIAQLDEGLQSEPILLDAAEWERIRSDVREQRHNDA